MASAEVVVSEVQVHLFPQPSDLLGKSDGLSRDAIIILSQSQVQSFYETGGDKLRLNTFSKNRPLDDFYQPSFLPVFYDLSVPQFFIWNQLIFSRSSTLAGWWMRNPLTVLF
jgi:hypothetical protein